LTTHYSNEFARRSFDVYGRRRWIIYGGLAAVVICVAMAFIWSPSQWLNRAGLLAELLGLAQLELTGTFSALAIAARGLQSEDNPIPSRFKGEMFATTDEFRTWPVAFDEWTQLSPKAGIVFIALGCVLQLIATCL